MENIFITKDNIETILSLLKDHLDDDWLYRQWLRAGNTGELQDFLNWVKADAGGMDGNIGEIFYWSRPEPPGDSLFCDGSLISREEYKDLFEVIGTIYGGGDGETTFQLPDLQNQFIRGYDINQARNFASNQTDSMQNITGNFGGRPFNSANLNNGALSGANGVFSYHQQDFDTSLFNFVQTGQPQRRRDRIHFNASRQVRTSHETRPININLLPCIRYKSNSKDLEERLKIIETYLNIS